MRRFILLLLSVFLSGTMMGQDGKYKVFPFKSAIIKYKQEGSTQGIHVKYIDEYGYLQADYTKLTTSFMGVDTKEEKVTILKGAEVYDADMITRQGAKHGNPLYQMYSNASSEDLDQLGKQGLSMLGYLDSGKEEDVLGRSCQIWEGPMGKLWLWKNLTLKSEVSIMGMKMNEVATSIQIDVSIPVDKFDLPSDISFASTPNYDLESMMDDEGGYERGEEDAAFMDKLSNMTYDEFKAMMLKEEPDASEEEIKMSYNMIKLMKGKK